MAGTSWVSTGPQSGSSLEEAQTAKKRPAIPSNFDFDPENGPSPSKRRMHDEVSTLDNNVMMVVKYHGESGEIQ